MTPQDLLKEINKYDKCNSPFYSAINLTNGYLSKCFEGTEHDILKKIYADYIFVEVLEEISNVHFYPNKKVKTKLFSNAIDKARLKTFKYRRNCYLKWINCVTSKKYYSENNLIQSLLTFFQSLSDREKIKELLGLNYSIEDINYVK